MATTYLFILVLVLQQVVEVPEEGRQAGGLIRLRDVVEVEGGEAGV